MHARAVAPEDVVGEEPRSFRIVGLQVLLVPRPIPVALGCIVSQRVVVHTHRAERGMGSVFEFGDPLVLPVPRSGQLHYYTEKKFLFRVVSE